MNAKTLEAIVKHGQSLLAAFPNATERDPVTLCKKLRRIETATHRIMTDYCNGDCDMEAADSASDSARLKISKLLDIGVATIVFINRDPRGYCLKLEDEWTNQYNQNRIREYKPELCLYRDLGNYGILAPDLNQ